MKRPPHLHRKPPRLHQNQSPNFWANQQNKIKSRRQVDTIPSQKKAERNILTIKNEVRNAVHRNGWTITEVVVVIALIGLLVSITLPVVQKLREAARNKQCQNNLKQIGLGLTSFHDTFGRFPPGNVARASDLEKAFFGYSPALAKILPFVDQNALYENYKSIQNDPSENDLNADFFQRSEVAFYYCPSDGKKSTETQFGGKISTNYQPFMHAEDGNTPFPNQSAVFFFVLQGQENTATRIADILDGTSNTSMFAETRAYTHPNTTLSTIKLPNQGPDAVVVFPNQPCPIEPDCIRIFPPSRSTEIEVGAFGMHGGVNVLFADTSVRFVETSVALDVWRETATKDGGEVTSAP